MNQYIDNAYFLNGVTIDILRLDVLHPLLQGNKFYKLKYNLAKAKEKHLPIVTLGGAFSNHIHATAQACNILKIPSYGIIRGENFKIKSHTLQFAEEHDMKLIYLNRKKYDALRHLNFNKQNILAEVKAITNEVPDDFYFIPEGGSNALGVLGAAEILGNVAFENYKYIYCPVGSGGTISGIINAVNSKIPTIGIACVNDASLNDIISNFTQHKYTNWSITYDFTLGGFAKWDTELIDFINNFYVEKKIALDPIYTGKMMFGLHQLLQDNSFNENDKILAIHTGGLQGIKGFNQMNNKTKIII